MAETEMQNYSHLEKPTKEPPNRDDKFLLGCTCVILSLGLVLLTAVLLILFLAYFPTVRRYHSDKCNVIDCNVTSKLCGSICPIFSGCLPKICFDTTYVLQLNNTNITVVRTLLSNIGTATPQNYLNTSLTCETVHGWTNASNCYYDDRNVIDSLTIYDSMTKNIGTGEMFGMSMLGGVAAGFLIVAIIMIIASLGSIKKYCGYIRCPCVASYA